ATTIISYRGYPLFGLTLTVSARAKGSGNSRRTKRPPEPGGLQFYHFGENDKIELTNEGIAPIIKVTEG
ncbi:MAG: hypothetical protein LUC47_04065, partial [Clostridiales bacterium]|nr:hypothetical protein [Clostridiales bacterium]